MFNLPNYCANASKQLSTHIKLYIRKKIMSSFLIFVLKCFIICSINFNPTQLSRAHKHFLLASTNSQNKLAQHSPPSSGFASFRKTRHDPSFVDKTGFIKVFLQQPDQHVYAMAPTGFGKSNLLDMLSLFLDTKSTRNSSKLFTGTEIQRNASFFDQHFQNYQIIRLDCRPYRDVKDFESFRRIHCRVICRMMSRHTYLRAFKSDLFPWLPYMDDNEICSTYCLANFDLVGYAGRDLSQELVKTSSKPVVFLSDDYDSIFRALIESKVVDAKRVLNKFVNFVSRIVKRNNCTSRSLLLGTLNFGGIHPHLANNLKYINFNTQPQFAPYFGFTKPEVERLLQSIEKTAALGGVTACYNGFSVKNAPKLAVYNPLSVLAFLKYGRLQNYWLKEAPSLESLKTLFSYPLIGNVIQDILLGNSGLHSFLEERLTLIQIESWKKYAQKTQSRVPPRDLVLNPFIRYLTQVGYLALKPSGPFEGDYLRAPNLETEQYLEKFLYESNFILNAMEITQTDTERLAHAFLGLSKNDSFFQELSDLIYDVTKKNPPSHYTRPSVLGYLYGALKRPVNRKKFNVVRAMVKVESSILNEKRHQMEERVDLVIITPDNTGIILRHELDESPYVNLKHIVRRRQYSVFKQKFKSFKLSQTIFMGLAFDDGECRIRFIRNTTDLTKSQMVKSPNVKTNKI